MREEIINNCFVNKLRIKMEIDEEEYSRLCNALICLAEEWKNVKYIDKEVAGYLYAIPQMVRNEFLSLNEILSDDAFCDRLEDMWVELDALVSNCFYNRTMRDENNL